MVRQPVARAHGGRLKPRLGNFEPLSPVPGPGDRLAPLLLTSETLRQVAPQR